MSRFLPVASNHTFALGSSLQCFRFPISLHYQFSVAIIVSTSTSAPHPPLSQQPAPAIAMEAAPRRAPLSAPSELAPGVLTLDVCVGGTLTYRVAVRISDLPQDPPGARHSSESLTAAIEERVFRRICHESGVYL